MKLIEVLIQHAKTTLDRPFTYAYEGEEPIEPGFRVLVPFASQRLMAFVTKVSETNRTIEELKEANGFAINRIEQVVDKVPLLNPELLSLADEVASYYLSPKIAVLQTMLPSSLKPTYSALRGPKIAYEKWVRLLDGNEEGLTPKQIEVIRLLSAHPEIRAKEAGTPAVLDNLVKAKRIEYFKKERERLHIEEYEKEQPHELTLDQQKAYDEILSSQKEVVLLQGVTGSGKTEVYLHLSEAYLREGKNILMLVPEISLTPIMVEYFSRRFQGMVAILHSELTPAEKYDEYRRIARGEARVVIGARSAVFAPLENIGLIILDEEHVESYKQDTLPFYHAREVAIMRARHFKAKVVLGSATPSLETRARADRGLYGFAQLKRRVNEKELPSTEIINLADPKIGVGKDRIFSKKLLQEIRERLEKKEQVVLLINRRGYSSYVACSHCGYIFTCPNCHGNLTYHKEDGMLKCHHCDYVGLYPEICPSCGSEKIMRVGFGTERLVKILNETFPEAKVGRLDSDIGKVRNSIAKTLQEFRQKEYDILVGTQMIAKGHDFPNVTLVGMVLADIGLSLPTYRASERTFQLITQAVGRSGRGEKTGIALIQTYNPNHYAITLGAKQDYERFYQVEMQQRKIAKHPPYVYLLLLKISSPNEEKAIGAALDLKRHLEAQEFAETVILGPITPYYALFAGRYQREVLIKTRKPEDIKPFVLSLMHALSGKGGVDILADVDPLDA